VQQTYICPTIHHVSQNLYSFLNSTFPTTDQNTSANCPVSRRPFKVRTLQQTPKMKSWKVAEAIASLGDVTIDTKVSAACAIPIQLQRIISLSAVLFSQEFHPMSEGPTLYFISHTTYINIVFCQFSVCYLLPTTYLTENTQRHHTFSLYSC